MPNAIVLIRAPTLKLTAFVTGAALGNPNRRAQAEFQRHWIGYALWVADPVVEKNDTMRADGTYVLGECCLHVSLDEPRQKQKREFCRYKLAAAVIQRQGNLP